MRQGLTEGCANDFNLIQDQVGALGAEDLNMLGRALCERTGLE